ncbi:hypothetical protein MGA3_15486 [Bacillus methanolicus MGA3]|nr:hypothetical protein MGA3_15486 [Bacillus methanolicus MGA3]
MHGPPFLWLKDSQQNIFYMNIKPYLLWRCRYWKNLLIYAYRFVMQFKIREAYQILYDGRSIEKIIKCLEKMFVEWLIKQIEKLNLIILNVHIFFCINRGQSFFFK